MIVEICCFLPIFIIIVFLLLDILLRIGITESTIANIRKTEPITREETCETSLEIKEAYRKLKEWTKQKGYSILYEREPRLMTIKPGWFYEKIDVELRENEKTMIRATCSGSRVYVEKSIRLIKDYFALLPP